MDFCIQPNTPPKPKLKKGDIVELTLKPGRYLIASAHYYSHPTHWGYALTNLDGDDFGVFDERFLKPVS
jgi:hypothetical protein